MRKILIKASKQIIKISPKAVSKTTFGHYFYMRVRLWKGENS